MLSDYGQQIHAIKAEPGHVEAPITGQWNLERQPHGAWYRTRISSFRNPFDFRLSFAYSGAHWRSHAPAHQTAARDFRLPERVHSAERLRAEPRGNRAPLRPLFAGYGAQAPDEPAGEGLHQASLEPQQVCRDGPGSHGRPRDRI